jgi:DNA polymerase-3 subunit beta
MKLTISQADLSYAIAVAKPAVSTRSTLPVLSNLLLSAVGNTLTVSATNLSIGIRVTVPATVKQPGSTTLPARLLGDWVAGMPAGDISLTESNHKVALACGRSRSTMHAIDPAEYPLLPDVPDGAISLEPATLRRLIELSTFAASEDDSRPSLTAVLTTLAAGRLTMAATDGYRLSVAWAQAGDGEFSGLIPAAALNEVARVLAKADSVSISADKSRAAFVMTAGDSQVMIVSQLVDAKFPDYKAIIPTNSTTTVTLDTTALARHVKVSGLFAGETADRILLEIVPAYADTPSHINVSAISAQVGDSQSDVDANVIGPGLTIALNGKYLAQALAAVAGPVTLGFTQATRPAMLSTPDSAFTHVIMPMQLAK